MNLKLLSGRDLSGYALGAGLAVGGSLVWAYWSTLAEMQDRWARDAQYSHGYLVPVFSLFLLWSSWPEPSEVAGGSRWWGLAFLTAGVAVRLLGTYFYVPWLDALSLLPCLAGAVVLLGGLKALSWSWPALGFLIFMVPLPYRVELLMSHPLRRVATVASTYSLQTLGFPALAEGNTILLDDYRLEVAEACNGLSMLVTFFALATAVAFVIRRGWTEKVLVVLSAVPIAVVANVVRITATGVVQQLVGSREAGVVFHDWAGWLMMPLALALVGLELFVLSRLLIEEPSPRVPCS
jgi:exosortase